jgi:DNA-directed RNA polymerase subunit RPC12/RpoP
LAVNENISEKVPDSCPHCGNKLSSWQQVLLKVDRAIVCKNCWYRILLDILPDEKDNKHIENKNTKKKGK